MWNKIKNSIWINALFLFLMVTVGYGSYNVVRRAMVLYQESNVIQKKVEELKKKKQELEVQLQEFENPEAIEREAKERLNLKRPGEKVVVVVPETATTTAQQVNGWQETLKSIFVKIFK